MSLQICFYDDYQVKITIIKCEATARLNVTNSTSDLGLKTWYNIKNNSSFGWTILYYTRIVPEQRDMS